MARVNKLEYTPLSEGSKGFTSTIYHIPSSNPPQVCKAFNPDRISDLFPVEKAVYERFSNSAKPHPPSILRYYGLHESIPAGLVLEYAQNHDVRAYVLDCRACRRTWACEDSHNSTAPKIPHQLFFRWASQAASGLAFAHGHNIYNADIHPVNMFLDKDLNLKVGDWAGASIDGSRSRSSYRLCYRLFDSDGTDVPRVFGYSARTEIFALGTVLWFMATGRDIWPELREPQDREEIKRRISRKEFPNTEDLPVLGDVIRRCWLVEYQSMKEVEESIDAAWNLWDANRIIVGEAAQSYR